MLASGLIILFQLPLARFARRVGAVRILPCGFLLLSASFLSVALFAASTPPDSWLRLLPAACFVTLLTMGQMLLVPSAKDLIPQFAAPSMLGAHYGALATAGGIAVLAGNFLLGSQLDRALTPSPMPSIPGCNWRYFHFKRYRPVFYLPDRAEKRAVNALFLRACLWIGFSPTLCTSPETCPSRH
jgi:MFS family permease